MEFTDWIGDARNVVFLVISLVMIGAAVMVVTSRNVIHAALMLVVALAGAAALFLMLGAEFVAWTVVLVYIGAVIVLESQLATANIADIHCLSPRLKSPDWIGRQRALAR